jgi:nucleotide-binding universal stress UspA family protein
MNSCIVCGLDETSGSRHAASIAARLARDLDSRAVLLHVMEGGSFLQHVPPARMGRTRRMRRSLKALADEHCFPDHTHIRVKTGHAATTLIAVAQREDAELVVVAAGGRSTVSTGLLGSVSSTLMREAPCPVVVVPNETIAPLDAEGMRSVVCGVADDDADPTTLRLADDLANRLGGQLHAVHAYDEAELRQPAEARLARALEEAGIDAHGVVVPAPPAEALKRVAEQHKASLLVVGFGGRSKIASIVLGSVPTTLATEGRTAVVVLPQGTRLEPGSGHYELVAETV